MPQIGDSFNLDKHKGVDLVIIDVVEREVPRKTDYESQKEEYLDHNGIERKHTLKNLAITDLNKAILFNSDSFEGKTHDKTITRRPYLDQISIEVSDVNILADLGFRNG